MKWYRNDISQKKNSKFIRDSSYILYVDRLLFHKSVHYIPNILHLDKEKFKLNILVATTWELFASSSRY